MNGGRQKLILAVLMALLALFAAALIRPGAALSEETCNCFPHESGWKKVEKHGLTAFDRYKNGLDATIGESCRECHGSELTGGFTGVSCYGCHAAFPHAADWKEPAVHGVWAFNNGWEENCKNACHGEDYLGGYAEKSCYGCHAPFPHNAEWADERARASDDYHGNYVLDHDAIEKRTCNGECHGADFGGGLAHKACADCHEAFPHPKSWSRPTVHGVYAEAFGVEEQCGIGCHGEDFEGGNTGVACYHCHENYPHDAGYETGHQGMSSGEAYQCATLCHGADLSGGLTGVSCLECHRNESWDLYKPAESFFRALPGLRRAD